MARVTRDPLADRDLAEIATYIGEVNCSPDAARRFLDCLNKKLSLYAAQPEMGELWGNRPITGELRRVRRFLCKYLV